MDETLRDAAAVPVPHDLAMRIKLRHAIDEDQRQIQHSRPLRYAFAAMLLLGVSVAGLFGVRSYNTYALNQFQTQVVDYVKDNPELLAANYSIPTHELERLIAGFGGTVTGDLGELRFAGTCVVRDRAAVHLVLVGTRGPVTVIYSPHTTVNERVAITDSRFDGVITPAGDYGGMVVLGEPSEPLDAVIERVDRAISW